jgi:hypothetical protein
VAAESSTARRAGPGRRASQATRHQCECHGLGRVHGQGVGRDGFEEVARQQLIQRFGGAHVTMVETTAASDETNLRGFGQGRPIVVPGGLTLPSTPSGGPSTSRNPHSGWTTQRGPSPGAAPRWRVPASRRASGPTPTTMWRWASGRDATGDERGSAPDDRPAAVSSSDRCFVTSSRSPKRGAAFSVQAAAGREPSRRTGAAPHPAAHAHDAGSSSPGATTPNRCP